MSTQQQNRTKMDYFHGAKFLHSLKLPVLLVILIGHLATFTQTQEVKSWTFNIPDESFVSFSPIFTNSQNQHLSLNFRTRNPNSLIFCHYLKDLDVKELERINYRLCGELQYGVFVLNYRLMQYTEPGIYIGKALNNNQWHSLDIFINRTSGELTVRVDNGTKTTFLKSYRQQNFTTLLDWTTHSSAIYFGGTDPETLFSEEEYTYFHGCMSDIRYENKEGKYVPIPVDMLQGVVEGCVDQCADNPCHHGGQCINDYDKAVCDCFGTDYQGEFCSELGPTSVTLRGYEWLTYSVHPYDENVLTETMRLSLEFKTSRGSGVLFYAVGGSPYHSHVTASVHAGNIQVSMAFGDEDINVQAGIGLDDYRWHNLTILHHLRKVYVYLDGQEQVRNITNDISHLALDPHIFVGGGKNFIVTRGLQVTQNFVGCLKNIYVNEHSVLYEMFQGSPSVTYNGGASTQPHYSCKEVVNIPISFPLAASMLKLDTTEDMTLDFQVEFDFKTVRSEAIVLYVGLRDTDTTVEYNFGYVEVWIKQGHPHLKFVPSTIHLDRSQNYTITNTTTNTNTWNSMHLSVKQGEAKLKVNGHSVSTLPTGRPLEIHSKIIIGYGFNVYKDSEGYVGCIRNLKVQGQPLDALDLLQTSAASGLIIDGCNITDYCKGNSMCEHKGVCLSEWTGVACDCTQTHYTGHACHFSKYKRTCDEYYQAGVTKSGVRLIDLDGSGPSDPVHVKCNMGYEARFEYFGRTIVEHNLPENTMIKHAMMRNVRKKIEYRLLDNEKLMQLTSQSAWCQQYIRYDCQHSPLSLGEKTWFKSASAEMVEYLGVDESLPGYCTCSLTDSCAGQRCNCDNRTMIRQYDAGYNSVLQQLPIIEIDVQQDEDPLNPGSGNITLGPLVCWGNKNQMPTAAVTFATDDSYLLSQAWKTGTIRVSFRTHHGNGIVLYQNGTQENINYFIVALTSDTTVKFYFRWGLKKLEIDIESPVLISDGRWHQVSIETDRFNVRCIVDMTESVLRIPEDVPSITMFSGVLFIGGVPETFDKDPVVADISGMIGCMRGLNYNDRTYSLSDLVDASTLNVYQECQASCWPNPCLNGAKCVENWGAHQCICVNPWAHSGHNCELDINTDSVTFHGYTGSYLHFAKPIEADLLNATIIFNFRTFLRNTILLYVHDHMNNFMQVQLMDGNKIVATFNRYNLILQQTRLLPEPLDGGEWNQVVIDNTDGYIKVIVNVDNEHARNSYKKKNLETYSANPFDEEELVKPVRPATAPEPAIQVYVGGVPDNMSTYTMLYGCIRGLKIGKTVFNLQEAARKKADLVSPVCKDGCETTPCKHGGICEEQWGDAQFICDCSFSEYAGPTCDTEASGLFQGSSILQYKYDPPKEAIETRTERLELIFQVSKSSKNMVLIFIYSQRYLTHDFIIVYLDPNHGVYLNTNQGYAIHGVGKEGLFADGKPHQLLYQRNKGEMILTVRGENHPKFRHNTISLDEEGIGRVTVPDNALDELDTIMIGGILQSQIEEIPDTHDYKDYLNFTGCMSEVKFYPVGELPFALRPLKDLRESKNSSGFVTVYGPEISGCNTYDARITTPATTPAPPRTTTDIHSLTFPAWNPGPAKTEFYGDFPELPGIKTSSQTTRLTTPSASIVMETEGTLETRDRAGHDAKVIVIAICVVAFLLILSIIVAVILVRIRRKERVIEKEEREKQQEFELKQPLDDNDMEAVIIDNHQNQNYLARLDEFSTVSASLGARPVKTDGTTTFKAASSSESSYTYSSVPQLEEGPGYAEPRFYNRKKNRPASSISEVLEEIERQRSNKDSDVDELATISNAPSAQQNPTETTPLSCHHDDDEENDADNESDTPTPPPPAHVLSEYNGDSGYEAESKPDEEEETLMIDSYTGTEGRTEAESPEHITCGTDTLPPDSPDSKHSNYTSENMSSLLSHSDVASSGKVSPTEQDNVINYGFPNNAVIELGPEIEFKNKPGIVFNGGSNT